MTGAVGATVALRWCARRPATWSVAAGRHLQLDDLGRSLHRRRSSTAIEESDNIIAEHQRARRQRRGLRQAQGGQGPARHDLGRRPVGAQRLLQGRAHRALRHQRPQGRLAALLVRPGVRDLDDSRRATSAIRSAGRRSASTTTRSSWTRLPDSWEALLDPKYKGRVVVENQPEEIVAYMGKAAGFDKPYNLTDDQLATVKGLPRAAQAERPALRPAGHRQRQRDDQRGGLPDHRQHRQRGPGQGRRRPGDQGLHPEGGHRRLAWTPR